MNIKHEFNINSGDYNTKVSQIADSFDPFNKEYESSTACNQNTSFGAGKRRCIGSKLAMMWGSVFMTKMILKYKIEIDNTKGQVKRVNMITTGPRNGLWLKLTKLDTV
mmetsp:Transcript_1919/g.3821  ORF Transcript_1919/g.3821 Transcript_1919/m.3821 type:complete len:108 (+) Transcript_1919:1141-1464(+)